MATTSDETSVLFLIERSIALKFVHFNRFIRSRPPFGDVDI